MAVIAITEQQLSLASAYSIRNRVIERFGESIDGEWVFPEPQALANASVEDLRSCGLSRPKAEYIRELADKIVTDKLDLDNLKTMDDNQARDTIMGWRGFGRWSADYILVRGLARPDCVPVDDLGIRDVVGKYRQWSSSDCPRRIADTVRDAIRAGGRVRDRRRNGSRARWTMAWVASPGDR
jgi:DNA-3-methyladenine glycosylase II